MTDFTPNLHQSFSLITTLLAHIHAFPTERLLYHAPVLDRIYIPTAEEKDAERVEERRRVWRQDEVFGLRKFVDIVEHHESVLRNMIDHGIPPQEDPLPSVQGMETFWKILITTEPPIVGVKMPMGGNAGGALTPKGQGGPKGQQKKGGKKNKECWVDVIARGGNEWVRVYSKKISHLLAEFREQDSYVNSDFDSSSEDDGGASEPKKTNGDHDPDLSNSLMQTAHDLLHASASAPRIPGASQPALTIWLTRIPDSPEEWPDRRIPKTLQALGDLGITVRHLSPPALDTLTGYPVPKRLQPSMKINFDITALLGLTSDVLHYPLPKSREEAGARSLRPAGELLGTGSLARGRDGTGRGKGKGKKEMDAEGEEGEDDVLRGQSQNSRELYRCILEEMGRPWIEEFNSVILSAWQLHPSYSPSSSTPPPCEFWATKQAAQYTFEALTSGPAHGEGMEQRRMKRMLGYEEGDWLEGSRYEGKGGILEGLKIRVFDDEDDTVREQVDKTGLHQTLEAISGDFLHDYYASLAPHPTSKSSKLSTPSLPNFLQPKKLPSPPVAKITLPFPVVSLHALHRGAKEGMTTVMMGTATFKEVWGQGRWRVRGWERGSYDLTAVDDGAGGEEVGEERKEKGNAAVMIFPYRVFGEGKRVRFEKGDYAYPAYPNAE
ncbi:hypothetical protein B9479_002200 [Cryptococcus floricola]|uniref:Uncharacterized protein n=1 Tax=Cryptococcus floricola TaxID=2591691 RepID=A0A5D3B3C7_9TREE|nr:hypothetical protein B9479_002200 [Cryptococcus floricola]